MGQFDHPVHRNERTRVKNTHTGAKNGVPAHSGAVWRTLMPSGGIWGARRGPQNKPNSGEIRPWRGVHFCAETAHHGAPIAQGA
jgi:hypothetical protein